MDEDTRLGDSKGTISINQSLTKDPFAWMILSYVILCVLDVNNWYLVYNFEKAQITLSQIIISSDIFIKSQGPYPKSFGFVTGLKNSSFNAIKVFKTNVTRSQRNGKDNTKIEYCHIRYI